MLMFLVRHAESTWNRQKKIQGQKDPQLSAYGRREAKLLAKRFRDLAFEATYASPLSRARETAEIILGRHSKVVCQGVLMEISLGDWEGKTLAQIRRKYGDAFDRWATKPTGTNIPNGESFAAFEKRVRKGLQSIEKSHRKGNVLVVCHGGVISTYVTAVLNLPPDDVWCLTVKNASLTIVDVTSQGRRLVTFNDVSHLMSLKEIRMADVTHVD